MRTAALNLGALHLIMASIATSRHISLTGSQHCYDSQEMELSVQIPLSYSNVDIAIECH